MRAMETQEAFGLDSLKLVERPVPEPGPGEILVRLKAAALNYRDVLFMGDMYGMGAMRPTVPLCDGAGEVAALGAGVTTVQEGDRVVLSHYQDWLVGPRATASMSGALGGPLEGCAREYICVRQEGVLTIPDHMSFVEAASIPCAGITAWDALYVETVTRPGDIILTQGTGGVSIFALQVAKAGGAEVIITSSSDEKLARAREMGADHTINYRTTPEWAEAVKDITGGTGVHNVLDMGGPETLAQSMACVRRGGSVSVIGFLTGPPSLPGRLNLGAHIKGITVGSRQDLADLLRAMTVSQIHPVVDKVYALEDLAEAFAYMKAGKHFGKVGISIG